MFRESDDNSNFKIDCWRGESDKFWSIQYDLAEVGGYDRAVSCFQKVWKSIHSRKDCECKSGICSKMLTAATSVFDKDTPYRGCPFTKTNAFLKANMQLSYDMCCIETAVSSDEWWNSASVKEIMSKKGVHPAHKPSFMSDAWFYAWAINTGVNHPKTGVAALTEEFKTRLAALKSAKGGGKGAQPKAGGADDPKAEEN